MFAERIVNLGNGFKDRLDVGLVEGALDYVRHNEEGLAFEILCDHICEYDIRISHEEYLEISELIKCFGFSAKDGPYRHLAGLLRDV